MFIILNGPLGIGKSTLAEALAERIDDCVMLDGDHLVATNPPLAEPVGFLHSTLALLVRHYCDHGYRHFVVNHLWRTAAELDALRAALRAVAPDQAVHCFLMYLPRDANLERIRRRHGARAIDEAPFEAATVDEERGVLYAAPSNELGERLHVGAPPDVLVNQVLDRLHLPREGEIPHRETPQA